MMDLLECPGCGAKVSDNTDFCSQCGSRISNESQSKRVRIIAAIVLVPLALIFISSMIVGNITTFLTQDESQVSQKKVAPILGHKERSLAISDMRKKEAVVDAAINQEGDELSLLLIVSQGISVSQAEALGEEFLLALRSRIDDVKKPGVGSGEGIYNYLLGVYTPDQKRIAFASQSQNETHLSW